MGQVIQLASTTRDLRLFNVVRAAVNERARNISASDESRRHALGVALGALREGRSTAVAICMGNQDMRPERVPVALRPGPEAA
ncbi:hypothetical protein LVB77_14765 [Lysobacter sp. 5GHs7-4]|uniref:hypothetical protein n=1 Tax=Lysobacter sp. 5GHs7-4 TaxID=2904253 RepID=UPI001E338303|nr:hypothetical protein [Lysobacter sp. 5GHs7-4]UHQ21928.1 hypothetical protein LVB77_14765 [Lysobacter sp. 5GHs7-4]